MLLTFIAARVHHIKERIVRMRIVDSFERDTMRDLNAIECDQVSGGGTPKPATPPPEPQLPPVVGCLALVGSRAEDLFRARFVLVRCRNARIVM